MRRAPRTGVVAEYPAVTAGVPCGELACVDPDLVRENVGGERA